MIFWISNLYSYKSLKNNDSLSPAATEWQSQFIRALNDYSKLIIATTMFLGRLEMLTIFVLLLPSFWKN